MPDVVFLTPNFHGYLAEESLGTLLLATVLQNSGIHSKTLPYYQLGNIENFDEFLQNAVCRISALEPKIVSFYSRCDCYHIALKLAQRIKEHLPNTYIIFGGPQADLVARDTISCFPYIDYICCGEGETTIVPFFSSLLCGTPDHTIRGLVYRESGQIVVNPRPELLEDLDSLPMIDYSLLEISSDSAQTSPYPFRIDVGRGCPFSCTFCSTKMFWGRKYRLKSPERIIEEIKYVHRKFGFTHFSFEHDMFTLNREKVIHVCELIKNLDFDIRWSCSARIDCLDKELIDIMADAGLKHLYIGVETGSPRMQKIIHKNLKLDNALELLTYISSKGLNMVTSFIFGFPEETEEDFTQSMELMLELSKLPKCHVQHHLCAFFPGTELTNQYSQEFERSATSSDITGAVAVQECEDIISAHPSLFLHFFEYKSELREKIKSFPSFFKYWTTLRPVYEYIAAKYYPNQLCQMLYDFTEKNQSLLIATPSTTDIIQEDWFIDAFSTDENYRILKEIARFFIWKANNKDNKSEVFAFDVHALLSGAPIDQIPHSFTIVRYTLDNNGKRKLTISKAM